MLMPIQRHDPGAGLFGRQVGGQGNDGGGYRARALQCAAEYQAIDRVGQGGQQAARDEDEQARDDYRFSAIAVGKHAKGDLQAGLGQAINTERQPQQFVAWQS